MTATQSRFRVEAVMNNAGYGSSSRFTEQGSLNSDDIAGHLNNRARSGSLQEWEGHAD